MTSIATFCDVPVSAVFNSNAASSSVSLDWVMNSGVPTQNSRASGLLSLPCDAGVMSMFLNDISVAASSPSDLVLGLDWFQFVFFQQVQHLDCLLHRCSEEASVWIHRPPHQCPGVDLV
ncbi:hypothetical protein B0H13DRAFT_2679174 [Mycena leptocephala]|nr:hypothetical protein B0H13DRAFT_2679174 [Mycena leptocephala]